MNISTNKLKSRYKAGDIIQVRLVEDLGDHAWLVSLEGTLIQVRNRSLSEFREGMMISVRLESLDPARLVVL